MFEPLLAVSIKLTDKDINHVPSPPPRRDSFHFSSTGTDPPAYSSLIPLANDLSPGTLTFTQNEKAFLKESYTIKSTSSYSYTESSSNAVQQVEQSTVPNDINNCTSAIINTQAQERKISSLKLTPVTIPDPPAHLNSYPSPNTQTTGSPSPKSPPPQSGPTLSQPSTQTAMLSVNMDPKNLKRPEPQPSNPTVELKVPNQASSLSSSQIEAANAPPAVPPRPSPAELLVHD